MENNEYFSKLLEYSKDNMPLWQATITATDGSTPARAGMKMLISPEDIAFGNLGGGEMEHAIIAYVRELQPSEPMQLSFDLGGGALAAQTSMICGGVAQVFIEALHNARHISIIGAGHCGKALGKLAKLCGFRVQLIDNREEILRQCPGDTYHTTALSDYQDVSEVIRFSPEARIVIMTHGHVHDKEVLQQCLRKNYCYLGMIGSKNKVAQTFDTLIKQGYNQDDLARVHAPIGLKIGSQSPYEIAISIMAEIIRDLRIDSK